METIISILIGYLIGSIPTAYLILKKTRNINITENGSNNVGALNSYEVSKSKTIGLIVLSLDFIKGVFSVIIVQFLFGSSFLITIVALTFAVLAHCYSPWIKFKGGRGLATAAGGVLLIEPVILLLWVLFWLIAYLFKRHIHLANILASILTCALAVSSSDILNSARWLTNPPAETNLTFASFNVFIFLIILSRHISYIKKYFVTGKNKIKGTNDE
ncbi:MAG: hypothetical protein CVV23_09450 [Ignavibacteriae bacterium HGW-Ignavibacteriae-2]|jgi:glycerol-3-phosphate acyltransferase PlsY|nr:MAG: hypothetical protein CVV23_09450 [Ignavibacteriae bacterium HGW-Ignavibacteriae-2]